MEIYTRGKNNGVIMQGRKYRFATLGFEEKLDERCKDSHNREFSSQEQEKEFDKELNRDFEDLEREL